MKRIINPWQDMPGYNCFGCAPANPSGVKMEFYEDNQEIVSVWRPQTIYQGWIDTLHGGIQAVLLDEICAWVVLRKMQTTGVTSRMEIRYKQAISTTDFFLILRASIQETRRNLATINARIFNQAGQICTEATCIYYTFPQEKAQKEMHFLSCEVAPEEIDLQSLCKE